MGWGKGREGGLEVMGEDDSERIGGQLTQEIKSNEECVKFPLLLCYPL